MNVKHGTNLLFVSANINDNCTDSEIGKPYPATECRYTFSIPEPDFIQYDLQFTITKFVEGHDPLVTVKNKIIVFEYPTPKLVDFDGPPKEGFVMNIIVEYPYLVGIKVVAWIESDNGADQRKHNLFI